MNSAEMIANCIDFVRECERPDLGFEGTWFEWQVTIGSDVVSGKKMAADELEVIEDIRPYIAERLGIADREGFIAEIKEGDELMPEDVAFTLGDLGND